MLNVQHTSVKTGAKIALIILLVNITAQLLAIYQTRRQLTSPLIPEHIIWEINKRFVFNALLSSIVAVAALLLYFFDKHIWVILVIIMLLIGAGCLPAGSIAGWQ